MSSLKERVDQFACLGLPGQPQMMHMGTSYLINDLWREVQKLRALLKEARQYVSDAGDYEEPGEHQAALLSDIDKALANKQED